MRLFSYVVRYDFGFAPNPFHGVCTLATCKAKIRGAAKVGDWIIGTGSAEYGLVGRLVYAMKVSETMSYDEYWRDSRFLVKRPNLRGSVIQAYGDNIYYRNASSNGWNQANSRHSIDTGQPNFDHIKRDTSAPTVLIGREFYFWGGAGPQIPARFRNWEGDDICSKGRYHRCNLPASLVSELVEWVRSFGVSGYIGDPAEFMITHR